ncbi:MAG: heparinase II/III domain-containing protein [Lewinella sp.]|uniref:heparinase II/III domain-containing protein n=1 Tax=Lewinella sp. TaxID=2004506 RepID=UPI003D6C0BAB
MIRHICTLILSFLLLTSINAQHPSLSLTLEGVERIRAGLGSVPLFDEALDKAKQEVDKVLGQPLPVPVPKDMAGGYTHEQHKKNWFLLQKAGVLFQITGEEKYAVFVRDALLTYAQLYPTLPIHPTKRSYATGKLFWQCLNDANWLVYVSQAYDCIYDWLSTEEQQLLNDQLFRPMANFLSVDNPQFFNRIHNHSTWANAAVGMIAIVMEDDELLQKALYGLPNDQLPDDLRDNDNGQIKLTGQKAAGFLAQLDYSFSPDGYFTEGPYYLRYAIYPFLLFSKALANNQPALDIFNYRDRILEKATYSLLNQADYKGVFFPINDSQKGMSIQAREVITAVDLIYLDGGRDPQLLSIAQHQQKVILTDAGFAVAKAIHQGLAEPFVPKSMLYRDGADGKEGGLAILRASQKKDTEICLVMKYTAQGMGHGHFDKLSYSLYDETGEVIQDYASARWVNIEQKGGGRYLRENNTWAKQSIAHNTLVVNETSHYNGDIRIAETRQPDLYIGKADQSDIQLIGAVDTGAYKDHTLQRTMFLLQDEDFEHPVVIDIYQATGATPAQFDLPTWFHGHLLSTNFEYKLEHEVMGDGHGYQHLWSEAKGNSTDGQAQITWFSDGKFYSQTSLANASDELYFMRLGANDPSFNLRRDPAFMIRKNAATNPVFISILESHGSYNPVEEIPSSPFGDVVKLSLLHADEAYVICQIQHKNGNTWELMLAQKDATAGAIHSVNTKEKTWEWKGPYQLIKTTNSNESK